MRSLRLIIALFVLALPAPLFAATMSLAPSASAVGVGGAVSVQVIVNPAGTAVNNAEAVLRFPADMLQVVSVSKSGSVFPLWVEDPIFSNTAGTVSFNGGVPNPGIRTAGTILSVSFRTVRAGQANLSLSGAAVRANDGLGTDVLTSASGTQIAVAEPAATAPVPAVSAPVKKVVESGIAPGNLASLTHPDQDAWYADSRARFSWSLPSGTTEVQTTLSENAGATPSVSYVPAISEKEIENVEDGTWYFIVRARGGEGWSPSASYRIRVDTEPPTLATPTFAYDADSERVIVSGIRASDSLSGIARYELTIDGAAPIAFGPDDIVDGVYAASYPKGSAHSALWSWLLGSVGASGSGSEGHTAVLAAFDQAANRASVEGTFAMPEETGGQTLWNLAGLPITVGAAIAFALLSSLLSLLVAGVALRKLLASGTKKRKRIGKRDQALHRALALFKSDLERHINSLDKAHKVRTLTGEEQAIRDDLEGNIDDLERYLKNELKKFD